MKIYNKTRGTMNIVPSIEVDKDTVYIRSNINKVDLEDFKGFEYDEIQYDVKEYIENLTTTQDTQSMAMLIAMLMSEVDFIKRRLSALEGK